MSSFIALTPAPTKLTAAKIGARVFGGELLLFAASPAMRRLTAQTRKIARECFAMPNPQLAHKKYANAEFLRRAEIAQKRVDAECKPLCAAALENAGAAAKDLFWDTLGLRIAPPIANKNDWNKRGFRSHVAVHRDTWGAGFQSQINWWSPVWPLAAQRTMGFFPSYWNRPLANTTAQWSFREFLAARKKTSGGRAAAYPSAPQAIAKPDEEPAPLMMQPGELLCFSSAHLHCSIPNATSLTRFSLEIRTVHLRDLQQQRGAPNVDNAGADILAGLYSSVADGSPLKSRWSPNEKRAAIAGS